MTAAPRSDAPEAPGHHQTGFEPVADDAREELRRVNETFLRESGYFDAVARNMDALGTLLDDPLLVRTLEVLRRQVHGQLHMQKLMSVPIIVHSKDLPEVTEEDVTRFLSIHLVSFALLLRSVCCFARGISEQGLSEYRAG